MGLLDRLAADLISSSIGVSPHLTRRLVRKAVGSPLLLAGGAALAGALISEMAREGQGGGATGPASWAPPPPPGAPGAPIWVPPPPPPAPPAGAGALPDWVPPPPPAATPAAGSQSPLAAPELLPPLPQPDVAEPELPAPLLYAVVRTMVAAALADGTLAPAERARIHHQLASGELAEEQAAQVRRDLLVPATPEELAAAAPGDGELLYRFALLVMMTDAGMSAAEETWLSRLGDALEVPADRRVELEAELFGTAL